MKIAGRREVFTNGFAQQTKAARNEHIASHFLPTVKLPGVLNYSGVIVTNHALTNSVGGTTAGTLKLFYEFQQIISQLRRKGRVHYLDNLQSIK
jgi:hypothetical protein